VYVLTHDTATHDYPSLARREMSSGSNEVMLAWERTTEGQSDIYYTLIVASSWTPPAKLPASTGNDRRPCVAFSDSGFGITWERGGQIMFAEYVNGVWRPAVEITSTGDPTNGLPQAFYLGISSDPDRWFVAWEASKETGGEKAVVYSLSSGSVWSQPDTLGWAGDNRNPRFFKTSFPRTVNISWESNRTGDWEIYVAYADLYMGTLSWDSRDRNISNNPLADDRNGSFEIFPIITESSMFYHTAATWVSTVEGSDSIAIIAPPWDWQPQYRTPAFGTQDRNPDISSGQISAEVRVWSVWENNSTGKWKLYGVMRDIPMFVTERDRQLQTFLLHQNYPNPFNPSTTLTFTMQRPSFVVLKICDILGRDVATLVNERRDAGVHRVEFSGAGLPSGVYVYRMQTGEYVGVRKMLLIK